MRCLFNSLLLLIALFCACFALPQKVWGKEGQAYEVSYRDSALLEDGSHILSTFLRLRNGRQAKTTLGIRLQFPAKWRIIGKLDATTLTEFPLAAGGEKTIPINLLYGQGVMAGWDKIKVWVWTKGQQDTASYFIWIHVVEKPSFHVIINDPDKLFSGENPGTIPMSIQIKNTGNIADHFRINGNANTLSYQYRDEVLLQPGQDTTIVSYLKIKKAGWRDLSRETISFSVTNRFSGKSKHSYFNLRKISSLLNLPKPLRREIPLTVGGGLLANGDRLTYFGQVSTSYRFGNHYIGISYRSKDMGMAINSFQRNAFTAIYSYKNFQILAGQVQAPKNFFTFGQGGSIRYRKGTTDFSVSAIKHNKEQQGFVNRSYVNDNIFANADYQTKKLIVSQQLESNFNDVFGLNSYLFHNEVAIRTTNKNRIKFFGGVGLEEKTRAADSLESKSYGWAGGYEYSVQKKQWQVNSNIRYRSSHYPGNFKGIHFQRHELFYNIGNFYLGPSLYYNGVERNTLRDTLYNTDYLTINSLKAGLTVGIRGEQVMASVGLGQLRQIGQQYAYGAARYADFSLKANLFRKTEVRFTASNAFMPTEKQVLFSTNTQLQISGNRLSFNAYYNKIPTSATGETRGYETVLGGPAYSQNFFKRALLVSLRYSFAKTLSEEKIRHGLGGRIDINTQTGLNVGISGFYPLKDPTRTDLPVTETRSGSIYITQRIGIRTGKKTDLNLKVILFTDANNNRICDSGEARISGLFFSVNNEIMMTDKEGMAQCKRLPRGTVKLNFLDTKAINLLPAAGIIQSVELGADETIYVAFTEGKKITGSVRIENDSMSHSAMTADNLKIIITDSFSTKYYALTDKKGNFSCMLPEGTYTVSLNAEIFQGSDFKPQQVQFNADLRQSKEVSVSFLIIQKKRKVRFLKTTD